MNPEKPAKNAQPIWCDSAMRALPRMYLQGAVNGADDCVFVYANTFFSVQEALRRGATGEAVRQHRTRVLRDIDGAPRPDHDKEQFAGVFARAVEDALEGRSPCVLQSPAT
jgi:hypothetical protein